MSLGIALSKLKVFSLKESLTYSLVRVLVGPLVGLFFVKFFDLSESRQVLCLFKQQCQVLF